MITMGSRLRAVRNQKGMTQGQVAANAHVPQSTLSDLETGDIAPKSVAALISLAEYYRCSVDYLLGISNDFRPSSNRNASEAALTAIDLVDSLPPEKRPSAVDLLRAIIVFADTGVPLPAPVVDAEVAQPEPVLELNGDVSFERSIEDAVTQRVHDRKEADLATLKRMAPPEVYEEVKALVDAGHLLTEAEITRFFQAARGNPLQQRFEMLGDGDTLSRG